MSTRINPKLLSWASDLDDQTIAQAARTARLPIVAGHVALMPDAHLGIGATVGSVIATDAAVIPSAVGVDIGCGMIACELVLTAGELPTSLVPLLHEIERVIPAGVGKGHEHASSRARTWLRDHEPPSKLGKDQGRKVLDQFGTLGSGNHFVEICLDERDHVWVVLHSGSRGPGNTLATRHINDARSLAKKLHLALEDPALAWFTQGTPEFTAYISDMLWAQDYALANREQMMDRVLRALNDATRAAQVVQRINCHHNFTQLETHEVDGVARQLWVTRKGAIKADHGDLGVIPGSMGTRSYIVRGRGVASSWNSCSHGAGRRMSRSKAKSTYTTKDLRAQMAGRTWLEDRAGQLVDEIPTAYKDIDLVMADQTDLVEILHTLRQVLNYKGT